MLFVVNVKLTVVSGPLEKRVRRDHVLMYAAFHLVATAAFLSLWPPVRDLKGIALFALRHLTY